MRKKTQYIVVNEIYKTIYCGYPQKRAWKIITTGGGGMIWMSLIFTCVPVNDIRVTQICFYYGFSLMCFLIGFYFLILIDNDCKIKTI